MLNVMINFDTNCYHSATTGGHHRPGVTDTLLSVTFTKKEDIFVLHLSYYISSLYNPVNPFGAISDSNSPTFYNL